MADSAFQECDRNVDGHTREPLGRMLAWPLGTKPRPEKEATARSPSPVFWILDSGSQPRLTSARRPAQAPAPHRGRLHSQASENARG